MRIFRARVYGTVLALAPALGLACSSSDPGSGFLSGRKTSGGSTTQPGSSSGGGGDTFGNDAGGALDSGMGACATSTTKGQQAPLDIYIMLDQSGSMNEMVSGGTSKWSAVTSAISAFVNSSQQGVSVGLQYFGLPGSGGQDAGACVSGASCQSPADCPGGRCRSGGTCACGGGGGGGGNDSCNAADYAVPDVEIAPLPGVASKISGSIAAHGPNTSTPTAPALKGAIDHATAWSKAHSSDVTIVVFATDGEPTECTPQDIPSIAQIAASGVNGTPKILTFVIGVGSETGNLDAIAQGGGTTSAFIVDTNANAQQQFLDALNKIRGNALGCSYSIPIPAGGAADFGAVNVQYTPTSGGAPKTIPKVADASACPPSGDAWHYDNETNPTQIVLCPGTCASIATATGEVNVVLGCATVGVK